MSNHLKEERKVTDLSLASCIYSQSQRLLLKGVHVLLQCIFLMS